MAPKMKEAGDDLGSVRSLGVVENSGDTLDTDGPGSSIPHAFTSLASRYRS